MSDIKLAGDHVVVEGTLDVRGPDLKLAAADRMSGGNRPPYRRALVHASDDKLSVNFNNDYLGVEINGTGSKGLKLNGKVEMSGTATIKGPDLFLCHESRKSSSNSSRDRRALVHGHEDQLVLNYGNDYLGIEINGSKGSGIQLKGNVSINSINIGQVINNLQESVRRLIENQDVMQDRIEELERKTGIRAGSAIEAFVDARQDLLKQARIRIPL